LRPGRLGRAALGLFPGLNLFWFAEAKHSRAWLRLAWKECKGQGATSATPDKTEPDVLAGADPVLDDYDVAVIWA
jgi:hypothetical protein